MFHQNQWALILGGSSGFGLATAKKLAAEGMGIVIAHRDRRGSMPVIQEQFDQIKAHGHPLITLNVDALSDAGQSKVIEAIQAELPTGASIHMMLHSIAFGNLKPIAPVVPKQHAALEQLADKLNLDQKKLEDTISEVFAKDVPEVFSLLEPTYSEALIGDEDMTGTIYSMGTSLLTWTQKCHQAGLFSKDARVIALTSEGNKVAWRGYAAVSAAKVALESVSRSIAVEFAPYGIRSNIIQAGVTDTKALRAIPGSDRMKAVSRLKNPFNRLTTPEDVANVISLLCLPEADWINGTIIRADGGEEISSF